MKWNVPLAAIGRVTGDGFLRVKMGDEVLAEVPAQALASAPVYHPPSRRPAYLDEAESFSPDSAVEPDDCNQVLLRLLASPNIASKEWVYNQFDYQIGGNTLTAPGLTGAGVIAIEGSDKAVAFTVDCNARLCYLDPRSGAAVSLKPPEIWFALSQTWRLPMAQLRQSRKT